MKGEHRNKTGDPAGNDNDPVRSLLPGEKDGEFEGSDLKFIFSVFVIPEAIASSVFVAIGFPFLSVVPQEFQVLFWCVLLIAGNGGMVLTMVIGTLVISTTGKNPDYWGSFLAVIIWNGWIYLVELIVFWIMSFDLLPAAGAIILAQFIGQYVAVVLLPFLP